MCFPCYYYKTLQYTKYCIKVCINHRSKKSTYEIIIHRDVGLVLLFPLLLLLLSLFSTFWAGSNDIIDATTTTSAMIIPRLSAAVAILLAFSSGGVHGTRSEQTNDATTLFLRGSNVDSDVYRQLTENSVKVTALRGAFLEWVEEHKRIYENVEEEMKRMLVWIENHGELSLVLSADNAT